MKRGLIIANLLLGILIVSVLLFYSFSGITGRAVFSPPIPTSCSDASIKAVWDSIFQESSNGITILTNTSQAGVCNAFLAYKINGEKIKILQGQNIVNMPLILISINMTSIIAAEGNFTSEYLNMITGLTSPWSNTFLNGSLQSILPSSYLKTRTISSSQADTEFKSVYKISPSSWSENSTGGIIKHSFLNNESNPPSVLIKADIGEVSANYTINMYAFSQITSSNLSCSPNWAQLNTSCQSNERLTAYYLDSKSCNQSTPANLTFGCDYDNNGIITSTANLSGTALSTYINYLPINTSENYIGKRYKVELKSGSSSVVEFDWNFSVPLNLENVYIEKQLSSATRGYLIVKGLNIRKKLFIDKLNSSSSSVCVKDQELNSIAGISSSCTGTNEYEVDCPGSNNNFTCNLPTGFFEVDGLTNSGVIEMPSRPTFNCTPNWNCTNWSMCSRGIQNRTCRDLNFCNINMPALNQSCSLTSCTPNWNCTNWSKCINGNQTRMCSDLNNCNTASGKPNIKQQCQAEEQGYNWTIISIIIGIVFMIIIIVILLIYFLSRKDEDNLSSSNFSQPPIPPSPSYSPPQYASFHPTYSQNMQNQNSAL
ncbi:hypothetical protein FJZ19_04405 [Candidatus Pacearchaeota archaeon]|nr:hypothetical protein [Candidatus Pacearchaeota archaeon]